MSDKIKNIITALQELKQELNKANEYNYEDIIIPRLQEKCSSFEWTYDAGISKLVILIRGEPQVIKIPFHSFMNHDQFCEDLEYWEEWEEDEEKKEPKPEESDYLYEFENAIIKQLNYFDLKGNDYCELECSIYELSIQEKLNQYFAEETWYTDIGDTCIYLQQKVTPFDSIDEKTKAPWNKETSDKCRSFNLNCFNSIWIKDFFDYYGEEEFKRLSNFLEKYNIWDLHYGNLGYYNNAPIIFDYSNFNEW